MAEDGGRGPAGEQKRRTDAAPPLMRIGGFVVERRLSRRDGFSTVYAARDPRRSEPVALRVFGGLADRPSDARTLLRTMALRRRLDHPGLVAVVDAGSARDGPWVAMPVVRAQTLADVLEREDRLTLERALRILTPVAGALDAAHAVGMVCDALTPRSVLVGDDPAQGEHGVLTDVGPPWPGPVRPGRMLGDVDGLAPEEIRGEAPSPRSNVYALGALLVRCVTGQPPFAGVGRTAVLAAHLGTPPPRPSDVVPELPAALDDVVAKALAKEPAARFASAGGLLSAASRALDPTADDAGHADVHEDGGDATADGAPVTAGPTRRARSAPVARRVPGRSPGRRLLALALVAVVLVGAGAVAAVLLGLGDSSPKGGAAPSTSPPARARTVASASLSAPHGAGDADAPSGAVRIEQRRGQTLMTVAGEHLAPERRNPPEAYAVWLYNSRRSAVRVGYVVPPVGRDGAFVNHQQLPPSATRYGFVVVTLERRATDRPRGPIVLRGMLPTP